MAHNPRVDARRIFGRRVTPAQWERLKPLFEEAARLSAAARVEFLERLRVEDAEIAAQLESLLEAEGTTATVPEPLVRLTDFLPPQKHFFSDGETIIGRFRIVRFLKGGGMGEVYQAEDMQLGAVALKTIRPGLSSDQDSMLRFRQEVQLARRVTNPNVCRIHDLFQFAGDRERPPCSFLTMELLGGETLAERIERAGPLPFAEAEQFALELCTALKAIHDAGVVHRDLKSRNIMLATRNGETHAVVMDLGLARDSKPSGGEDSGLTNTNAVMGTPEYMAPEQFQGPAVTPAADIYALGIVLYELATGIRPFQSATPMGAAVMRAKRPAPVSSVRAGIPKQWDEVVNRCLEFEPEKRWASALHVADALKGKRLSRRLAAGVNFQRRPLLAAGAAALVIAVLVGSIWLYRNFRSPAKSIREQRIAVLPFEDIGGSSESQAFRDGLTETLSSKLTELEQFQGSLSVVPASDVRKEKVTSAREAQRDFGVNLVITGSIQRSPSGMRLTINVVDARQLKQLRSHGIFIPATDAVSMQQGVITQVTDLLDIQLRPEATHRIAEGNTPIPEAYDSYLKGSGYLLTGTSAVDHAITEFRHALDQDPNYALAHAGLGEAYWNKYIDTKDEQWIEHAWQECRRSIELAPQLAAPHVTLALLNSGTGHYDEAIRQAQEAISVDPGNGRAYSELARALDAINQPDAAEATLRKAIALQPGYWNNYVRLGIFYVNHGKYQDAIDPFTTVIKLVPENPAGYTDLGTVYHLQGREAEAGYWLNKSIRIRFTPLAYSNLATVYFFQRRYADAVPIFEKLTRNGAKDYEIWGNLGDAYRWTPGNAEKAVPAYRHAIELAEKRLGVNPRDARALIHRALYRAKTGQSTEAVEDMDAALVYASDDKNILFNSAIVCELTGRRALAFEYLGKAISGGYSLNEIAAEPELGKLREASFYKTLVSHNSGH